MKPESAKNIKPGWYWVLACVDAVDHDNQCVHITSSKASHWYHFDNVFEAPTPEKIKVSRKEITAQYSANKTERSRTMTKVQELFFKAGLHKGRAEYWLKRRKGHIPRTPAWLGFTQNMEMEEAKSARYLKRAELEARKESI